MIKNFNYLWQEHFKWSQGVLVKKVIFLKTADIYIGNTPDAWYNFALPKVMKPKDLDLKEIKKVLSPISSPTTIYLFEKHIKAGFPKFLTQNGWEFFGSDTWMVFNPETDKDFKTNISAETINLAKFPDYEKVTVEVFGQEGYDDGPYNKICQDSLTGKLKSKEPSFSAEFFMIYQNRQPTAGAGLFLTKEIGYFHNDATFKKHRGKGYHTTLIKKRVDFCLKKKIKTLYSIVEYEKQSFRNFKKCGFETWQVANLFTLKKIIL